MRLSFSFHISKLACSCYYRLRQLRLIRKSLTTDSCHTLVRALIISRLDYCNNLLSGIPRYLLHQLDGVLRAAAHLILQRPRIDHITDAMLRQLHWLAAPARIQYKLCVFAFKCLNNLAPPYLSTCCTPVASVSGRSMLRSAAAGELVVPAYRTSSFGRRAFAVTCPAAWNSLPSELHRSEIRLRVFKEQLKTVLFRRMTAAWITTHLNVSFSFIQVWFVLCVYVTTLLWDFCREQVKPHNNNNTNNDKGNILGTVYKTSLWKKIQLYLNFEH